jgi:CRP-like cAMP-binding protein
MMSRSQFISSHSESSFAQQEISCPLFHDLDHQAQELILGCARLRTFHRGEVLCHQGELATSLYLLTKGLVKVSGSTRAGHLLLFNWMHPSEVIGVGAILSVPTSYLWTATSTEETQAFEWDKAAIKKITSKWVVFYENALWIALQWSHELQERLQVVATGTVAQRVAHLLLHLLSRADASTPGASEVRISEEEIAQMVGTNLYTVNKILNLWRRGGYLDKTRQRLAIKNADALARISFDAELRVQGQIVH